MSEFENGAWTTPRLLPAPINSDEYEYGPWVADGWLYFTSHRGGNADTWRVPLSTIRGRRATDRFRSVPRPRPE